MPAAVRAAPALYAVTLFASALLLFAIQPMFTKMVLPRLGGAPSVWSVAMVFFQAVLLAGYAYAHVLTRMLAPRHAALVHLALLAMAGATLPIGIAAGFTAPPAEGIALWLFVLFAASIGLPFVALSASAPLLQNWFAASGHPRGRNPYVLYAASNLGSFAALLAYPVIIEPLLPLRLQAQVWSAGFACLAILIAISGLIVARNAGIRTDDGASSAGTAPTWAERGRWIALAAIPSGLVIAVTAHLTTDIAAAPFLWVIPLALYLLTFVAIFRERPWISHAAIVRLTPFVVAPLAVGVVGGDKVFWLATIVLNVVGFVVLTMLCHGELYARRPSPRRVTEFYLLTSLGGVIGGVFAGLAAPHVFNGTHEYPILIALALLALPGALAGRPQKLLADALPALALAVILVLLWSATDIRLPASAAIYIQIGLIALVALMLIERRKPLRVFSLVVLSFVVTEFWRADVTRIETVRSFFGVHRIVELDSGKFRLLYHGTTIHGAEQVRGDDGAPLTGRPEPLTYYYTGGPISDGIAAARTAGNRLKRVAAIGLGTGSLACHREAGEAWTFFEIDPEVIRIARDPRLFRFLSACAPDAPIVLGDARLTLDAQREPYDLIVLDAFSSDAIPVHLLTREAFAGYLARLAPQGVIVVHISNRHMELAPVVAGQGLVTYLKEDREAGGADFRANARVGVLARAVDDLGDLPMRPGWELLVPEANTPAWTDDFSNILGAIWRKKVGP
jgi:hypothetical protein